MQSFKAQPKPAAPTEEMVALWPLPCCCSARAWPHLGVHGYNPPVEYVTWQEYERRLKLGDGAVYGGLK
jgi:hypothetical protein